jgi:hypothetical protein
VFLKKHERPNADRSTSAGDSKTASTVPALLRGDDIFPAIFSVLFMIASTKIFFEISELQKH